MVLKEQLQEDASLETHRTFVTGCCSATLGLFQSPISFMPELKLSLIHKVTFLKGGLIISCISPCNSHTLLLKKPNEKRWRFVENLIDIPYFLDYMMHFLYHIFCLKIFPHIFLF